MVITGLNIANRLKYIILFLSINYRNLKKIFQNLKFYINRIFTPDYHAYGIHKSIRRNYQAKSITREIIRRKALPSILSGKKLGNL